MITAKALTKNFGISKAINNMDIHIRKGECFGLLGPNGAGKSTFIGMTYGAVERSSGELRVFGLDPKTQSREIKKRLGVVIQENALDESLTVLENMLIYCSFQGIPKAQQLPRINELLEYMNLSHKKDALIQMLSGGMKRRLVFVRALLGKPELLILDEPTTGLDPAVRHLLWGKVKELREQGTTIVLTTHYMHEAEVLCDRLVILNQGEIKASASPRQLIEQHTPGYVGLFNLEDKARIQSELQNSGIHFHEDGSNIYLRAQKLDDLISFHVKSNLHPLQIRPANLEDVFLKITGSEINHDA